MLVGRHMTETLVTISPGDFMSLAREKMQKGNFRRLPVVEEGKLLGIITDRDLREHRGYLEHTKVNAAMTEHVITVSPQTTLEEATLLILQHKIGGLPVVEDGRVRGMITSTDVLHAFLEVLGVSSEGTARIDLLMDGEDQNFADASRTIESNQGEIMGVGTHREKWGEKPVFYVRVRAADPHRIAECLKNEGYTILGVQQ